MNPAIPTNPDPSRRKSDKSKHPDRPKKNGVKKVFPRDETGKNTKVAVSEGVRTLDRVNLNLPIGPEVQVHSVRLRTSVDTFLKNTSTVHTGFRSLLQGPDGGFQGDMNSLVIARIEDEACVAALAIVPDDRWFIHSLSRETMDKFLSAIPKKLKPARMEGEKKVLNTVLQHKLFATRKIELVHECYLMELEPKGTQHGPGGHHRLAQQADIPRLEEYSVEYEAEIGLAPPSDWDSLLDEKRIMLGVYEGTIASVAVRGPETFDHLMIEGIYTFQPFRRRGLARRLVSALTRQAAGKGLTATAVVGKNNKPMLELLDTLQFLKTSDYQIILFKKKKS
jgi:GNAT superfamily N-acetyltransferase